MKKFTILIPLMLLLLAILACNSASPTIEPTVEPTATKTASHDPTETIVPMPIDTPTPEITIQPTATIFFTPTPLVRENPPVPCDDATEMEDCPKPEVTYEIIYEIKRFKAFYGINIRDCAGAYCNIVGFVIGGSITDVGCQLYFSNGEIWLSELGDCKNDFFAMCVPADTCFGEFLE
jgi:hypothetical protein